MNSDETILSDPIPPLFAELTANRFNVVNLESTTEVQMQAAVAIVAYSHPTVDAALLDRCPNVRVISNHGVGVDHIDLAAAAARRIPVGNTPGCLDASTADLTIALILSVARNVVVGDRFARSADFQHYDPAVLIGQEVTGGTIGIVGMGRIGVQVAKRAIAFDMKVLYHNRNRRADIEDSVRAEFVGLPDLLRRSDFVVLNCPLTTETTGLIGKMEFQLMKSSAILINMARGAVVQTEALYDALRNRDIHAAGLDVTDPEPLPRNHPLLKLDNVIITPHLGSASNVTRRQMMQLTVDNLIAGIKGEELPYRVY